MSRLTTQWQEAVREAILQIQREAERRIEELVTTVDRLTSTAHSEGEKVRSDLNRLNPVIEQWDDARNS